MLRHNDRWPPFDVVKPWRRQWTALTRALAELEGLREEFLTLEVTMPPAGEHGAAANRDGKIELLLIRMESLDLDSGELKRSAPSTFCALADRADTECFQIFLNTLAGILALLFGGRGSLVGFRLRHDLQKCVRPHR
jgi:hypothetical protein